MYFRKFRSGNPNRRNIKYFRKGRSGDLNRNDRQPRTSD